MKAYKSFDVSDICYPYEAAAWVAFGRLPEVCFDENGMEVRGDIRSISNGYGPEGAGLVSTDEISKFCENDAEAVLYLNAKYIDPAVSSIDEYFNGNSNFDERARGFVHFGPCTEDGYIGAKLVESIEYRIGSAIERGRMKVLLSLMEGTIVARGIEIPQEWQDVSWDDRGDDFWEEIEENEPTDIPKDVWTNSNVIWSDDPAEIQIKNYLYPVLRVPDLISAFPFPDLAEEDFAAKRMGGTVFLDVEQGANLSAIKRSRGRQLKGDGAIATGVKNEFKRRFDAGLLPEKSEAIYAEVIEWVYSIFDEKISRSTAQRYAGELAKKQSNQ
jgi:hypothetical protein